MAITKAGTKEYLWLNGELSWKYHATQRKIDKAVKQTDSNEVLVLSTRQLGKSYWGTGFGIETVINACFQNPGCIVRVLAPTLKQVSDIVGDNLAPICRDAPPGLITRHKSDFRWQIADGTLRLGSLERAHVDNNRGGNAILILIEEGCFVNSDDYVYARTQVLAPQLLRSGGKIVDITTLNKDEPDHYIVTELKPRCALKNALFEYTIYDNPQLSPEDIQRACDLAGGPQSIAWRTEYLNEVVRNVETTVIPTFSKEKHVKQIQLPDRFNAQVAIDFGGVRDKTVALLHCYDYLRNKRLWLRERVFDANTDTSIIVHGIREMEESLGKIEIKARYADAQGQTQVDLASIHDYEIQVPVKDDWRAGINALQVSIGQDQHEIDPSCRFLIQTLESGRFNKQKTDFERTMTLGHCDAIAAMMYGNRMTLMENPYPYIHPDRDTMMRHKPRDIPLEKVSLALNPKSFANSFDSDNFSNKKFGTFKR